MQWYEDEAYVSWQSRDGLHAKYLERARRYAKRQVDGEEGKPRKITNEVVAASVQLNSEYSAWTASMFVERQRCILYTETIAQYSLSIEKGDNDDDRLEITAAVAMRIANDVRQAKHWSNVWNENTDGNKKVKPEVEEEQD